jgi:hypothetical protein
VCLAAGLAAAAWLLYLPVAHLWWTHDDLYHLHLLLGSPRAWYFWDRAVYRAPPPKMLTPFLFLSLDVDRRLFGLRPAVFHLHQLAALSLAAPALYAVLRLWLARRWAAVGAFLFLLGAPVASLVLMVMVRHYIEMIVPAALAVALWVLALRRPERGWMFAVGSALCWLAAALSKEIAVPLVLFLLLIPEGSFADRLRRWAPHALLLLVYIAIRVLFLGTPKGYGFEVTPRDWPRLALELPVKIGLEMRGLATPAAWLLLAALLAGLVIAACRSRGAAVRVLAALALALGPVLPVSSLMEPRYAIAAWLVAAVTFPFACRDLERWGRGGRQAAGLLALVACLGGLVANRQDWTVRLADSQRRSAEWRAFLTLAPGELLRRPLGVPGELGELRWWKEDVLGLPQGAGWFLDDLYLCLHPPAGRIWGWDDGARRVADLTPRLPALRRSSCGVIRGDAPLRAEIRAVSTGIRWDLGPYTEGHYGLVLSDGLTAVEVPASGGFLLRRVTAMSLRVKYESPEGWTTYSPELALAPGKSVRWAR